MIGKKKKNKSIKKLYNTWNSNYHYKDGIHIANPTNEDRFGKTVIHTVINDKDEYVFLDLDDCIQPSNTFIDCIKKYMCGFADLN